MQDRKLGFLETYRHLDHEWLHGLATIGIVLFIKGKVNFDVLKDAFYLVYNRHPLLQATIYEKENEYYFSFNNKFQNIPLNILERNSDDAWNDLLEKNLNIKLTTKKYLWKAELLIGDKATEIALTFHHSIIDGLSVAVFVYDLLTAYSNLEKNMEFKFTPLPLQLPVEYLLPENMNKDVYFAMCGKKAESIVSLGLQKNFIPISERYTKIICHQINKEVSSQLLKSCMQHKVSINSLLNALMLFSAQKIQQDQLITVMINPFSLRQYCKPRLSQKHIGCYSYPVTTRYKITFSSDIWSLARDYQWKLEEEIKKHIALPATVKANDIKNKLILENVANTTSFPWGMFLTNAGNVRKKLAYGSLKLDRYIAGLNLRPGTTVFSLATGIFNEKIELLFLYTEPLIKQEQMEKFIEYYINKINEI